jgi:hypothetical protein
MQHAGSILFAAISSRCRTLNILGDRAQIPYICRLSDYSRPAFYNLLSVHPADSKLQTSYRCPLDVCAILRPDYLAYGLHITGTSNVRRSLYYRRIRNPAEVPRDDDTVYLTFKQTEKTDLLRAFCQTHPKITVKTVHEFQGSENKKIIVVRLSTKTNEEIYNRKEHVLVALTRHTQSLEYLSVCTSHDKLSRLILTNPSEADIDAVRFRTIESPIVVGFAPRNLPIFSPTLPSPQPESTHDHLRIASYIPAPCSLLYSTVSPYLYNDTVISFGLCPCPEPRLLSSSGLVQCTICETYLPVAPSRNFQSLRSALRKLPNTKTIRILGGRHGIFIPTLVQTLKHSVLVLHTARPNDSSSQFISEFSDIHCLDEYSYVPAPADDFDVEFHTPRAYLPRVADPVTSLQHWYDNTLPQFSTQMYDFDTYHVHTSDLDLPLQDVSFSMNSQIPEDKYDSMIPVLRTALPHTREQSLVESLLALLKRNMNCPDLSGLFCDYDAAGFIADKFIESYVDPSKLGLLHKFQSMPISPNKTDIHTWLKTQTSVPALDTALPIHMEALNVYDFIIKRNPKPRMESSVPFEYASLQTVIHHKKHINAYFSPMIKAAKERLKMILRKNVKIFTDTSPSNFAHELDHIYPVTDPKLYFAEVDMSKYDKSQHLLHLLLDVSILLILGFPPLDAFYWFMSHEFTIIKDRKNRITFRVVYQRKSGDALTFFGNTLIIMCVCCIVFDLSPVLLALFAGDDSLLGFPHKPNDLYDVNSLCAQLFNFESKIFEYSYPSFCSKFLLATPNGWSFVPDPLKLVTKLGRSDLAHPSHVSEYYISFCDLVSDIDDAVVADALSEAISERYKFPHSSNYAFSALVSLTDFQKFKELYYAPDNPSFCYDPSKIVADI